MYTHVMYMYTCYMWLFSLLYTCNFHFFFCKLLFQYIQYNNIRVHVLHTYYTFFLVPITLAIKLYSSNFSPSPLLSLLCTCTTCLFPMLVQDTYSHVYEPDKNHFGYIYTFIVQRTPLRPVKVWLKCPIKYHYKCSFYRDVVPLLKRCL